VLGSVQVTLAMIVTSSTAKSLRFLAGPSLKHFILRQQVLSLYRNVIRATRCTEKPLNLAIGTRIYPSSLALPLHSRSETVAWIRHEFERNKHLEDTVRFRLSSGRLHSNTTGQDQGQIDDM
jgi:hypothetical protein